MIVVVWLGIATFGFEKSEFAPVIFGLPFVVVAGLAFTASASFRQEMETGALELLLVTPLYPGAILFAKIITLWWSALSALLASTGMAFFWMCCQLTNVQVHLDDLTLKVYLACLLVSWTSFLAVPLVAARFGVRRLSPIAAWLWTIGVVGALPCLFGLFLAGQFDDWGLFLAGFVFLQLFAGHFCGYTVVRELATRKFQLKPLERLPI